MKVSCSACGLEYSVPDRRVQGRRVKFRCKQCSTDVLVDGTVLGPPLPLSGPAWPAVSDPSSKPAPSKPVPPRPAAGKPPPSVPRPAPRAPGKPADWAALEAPTKPGVAAMSGPVDLVPSWVVDLGGHVHETMSSSEICELFLRESLTGSTLIRRVGSEDWRPLSNIVEITQALSARGISLLPRVHSARGSGSGETDFAGPTRQIRATELWKAAGVEPPSSRRESDKAPQSVHEADTAMLDQRRMLEQLRRPAPSPSGLPSAVNDENPSDNAITQLYQGDAPQNSPPEQGAVDPFAQTVLGAPPMPLPRPPQSKPMDRARLARIAMFAGALLIVLGSASLVLLWLFALSR